jgi:predicted ester cyclase
MLRHNRTVVRMTFILAVMVLVSALSSASLMASTPEAQVRVEANKAVAELYFGQVLSKGDVATADAILAPSFARIDRSHAGVELGQAGTEFLASYYQLAFPELTYTIDAMATEGDQVAVCWTAEGVVGAYPFANAGEPVTWTGMSFLRIADGRIMEELTNLESMESVLGIGEGMQISPSYAQ